MSTKIYNAYKLKESASLAQLTQILDKIRSDIEEVARKDMANKVAGRIQYYKDLYKYYGEEITTKITNNHILKMLDYIKADKSDNRLFWEEYPELIKELKDEPYEHTTATLQMIPCSEKILAIYCGPFEYIDFVSKNEFFEDYHYQNQTDKPDDIADKEWEEREKDWDKAIGPDYIPARHGLSYTLLDYDSIPFYSNIICNQELINKAVKNAEESIKSRIHDIRHTIECPLFEACKSTSDFIKVKQTDEYKTWKEAIDKEIKKRIK